ncbi:chaperonin 10-like protein [Aspergillus pseudonomiae]|uniref:Chaperonin 10-like protein n=1 Tax=Aspergillus pseudonomiae TaxID=1506151 RepID=A0A5N6I4P5_9EURO|nr:chaperonin 10-like protein [Aspergillus pseudonomiae]KAB8261675.1 chaperonin 10-like protein [Aspergillus pseudonomiae]KAE8406915.1 chaperonin 10-like protein [Aspergillus pseudonomiae]
MSSLKAPITTKAYVVEKKGAPFVLCDIILDQVQSSEVLVEIKYTGLCHTDVVVQQGGMPIGQYPVVLGHEGVGIVRQVGSEVADKSLKEGDTVLLSFHACGRCNACLDGRCGSCPHMTETNFLSSARSDKSSPIALPDGTPVHGQFFGQSSLSKMAIVTEKSVVKISAQASDLQFLAPFSCGYLTGAGTVLNALCPNSDSKIAIIGMGGVGLAAMLAARAIGVQHVVAVDMLDAKLEMAASLGATHTVNTKEVKNLATGIHDIFPDGVDYILDTTGVASLLQDSLAALAHEGTLALVGVPSPAANIQVNALDLLLSCKKIIGVIEGRADPKTLIPRLVQLFNEGKFPVNRFTKCYPAGCLTEALEDLKSGSAVKAVLSWDDI